MQESIKYPYQSLGRKRMSRQTKQQSPCKPQVMETGTSWSWITLMQATSWLGQWSHSMRQKWFGPTMSSSTNSRHKVPTQWNKLWIIKYPLTIKKQVIEVERLPKEAHWGMQPRRWFKQPKNHTKATIAGCDSSFPMHLWDRLLPQIELSCSYSSQPKFLSTSVPLRQPWLQHNTTTSTWCPIQHLTITTQTSQDENSKDGFHVGTCSDHYHMYDLWMKATQAIQNCEMLFFKHQNIMQPTVTKTDIVADSAHNLIEAVKGNYALVNIKTELKALDNLVTVFLDATKKSKLPRHGNISSFKFQGIRLSMEVPRVSPMWTGVALYKWEQLHIQGHNWNKLPGWTHKAHKMKMDHLI